MSSYEMQKSYSKHDKKPKKIVGNLLATRFETFYKARLFQ